MSTATDHDLAQVPAGHRIDLALEGMMCASCAARIERRLNKLDDEGGELLGVGCAHAGHHVLVGRLKLVHRDLDRHGYGWEGVRDGVADDAGWPLYLARYADSSPGPRDGADRSWSTSR